MSATDSEWNQLITVVPDNYHKYAATKEEQSAGPNVTNEAVKLIAGVAGTMFPLGWLLLGGLAVKSIYDAVNKARSSGLDMTPLTLSEAKLLSFPPGHPMPKVVYCRHPANASLYYPLASFHRHVFEHKFAEAVKLLGVLGAREISVKHLKGWSRDFAAEISSPIPTSSAPAQVGVTASAHSESGESVLFKATLKGSDNPRLIESPTWLPHESMWQTIADLRIECGLQEFSLSLNYEEDYQVNASLNAKIKDLGFDVGGKFEDHVSTIWTMNGIFGVNANAM